MSTPTDIVRDHLTEIGLSFDEPSPGEFTVELPGENKLKTACVLAVGDYNLEINAFVARRPDENVATVYRWLLERNARLLAIAFCVDGAGDIYLVGRLPLSAVTAETVDGLLGSVLNAADSSFNPILEMGFAESIREEWRWRLSRGESTGNLAAFQHLRPAPPTTD